MNRSFRAPERGMQGGGAAPGAKHRQQNGDSLRTSMMKEKEEEVGMFLEMKKREKERNNLLFQNTEEFDAPLGSRMGSSPIFSIPSAATPARKTGADDFLNSDNDKNDYDWLLTPPGTPLFPSLEMESQRTVMSQLGTPKARPTALKSRLADSQPEPTARSNSNSRQPSIPPGSNASNTSNAGIRRPSSSGGPASRPSTPTGRGPTLTTSKPASATSSRPTPATSSRATSSRPTSSRPTSTISSKPTPTAASRPSRSSTPNPRPTLPSTKPTLPTRSSTPTTRSTPRSSTPTTRPTLPATKPVSRTATPTRRPNAQSSTTKTAMSAPGPTKSVPSTTKTTMSAPPRASSPTVKPRILKPSEMPGFSYDAPPNLRTSLSDRPISATRGRAGAPSIRSSSVDPAPNGRGVRRQSCSPSRGRAPNGVNNHIMGGSVPALNRAYAKANDHVTPGQYGTNMVDRVINMRKLMPPKQDDKHSPRSNLSGKSSSPDSMGIGRTLSKKSIDMAIRHMDLRRTIPGNLRPMMTNIPASSMYSVRSSGPARSSRTISMLDSPLATTSSNASSEMSVNNNALCLDGNVDDEINSEKGVRTPTSLRGRHWS